MAVKRPGTKSKSKKVRYDKAVGKLSKFVVEIAQAADPAETQRLAEIARSVVARKQGGSSKDRIKRSTLLAIIEAYDQDGAIDLKSAFRMHEAMGRRSSFSREEAIRIVEEGVFLGGSKRKKHKKR